MMKPRFTFCIPNLNKIDYLPACIDSMLAQDCDDWQCVFVDGFSTDGCWEYMQRFAGDPRFRLLRGLKQGMYADWNECLQYVDTEYFYILTSDDTCYPELVSKTIRALDAQPDIDVCHFKFAIIDEAGKVVKTPEQIIQQEFDLYAGINQYCHRRKGINEFIMHFVYRALYQTITSLVFRKPLIQKLVGFRSCYGSAGDYDWTMRLGLFTDVLYIPILLSTWRVYSGQATRLVKRIQHKENLLNIAEANLNYFFEQEQSLMLACQLDSNWLLSSFRDEHAASLFEAVFHIQSKHELLYDGRFLWKKYPFYLFQKLINRMSFRVFYYYPSRIELAHRLIERYDLQWFPEKLTSLDLDLNLV
jgi:glycosyltransferase involved in cell wall biosynthesis